MNYLLVFIGGGVGSLFRYVIGTGFQKTGFTLPWATFVANFTACLVFAITMWFLSQKSTENTGLKALLLTGFCGGLSTFSTFGYETFLLFKQQMPVYALLNIAFSAVACIFVFYIFNR